jgi:hypothetical protein
VTSFASDPTPGLPEIPAHTFHLSEVSDFRGIFSWNESRITGFWQMNFNAVPEMGLFVATDSSRADCFYPLEYVFNEHSNSGSWLFTGTRNVPEAGSTLLYLALGMIILSSAGIKRLAWRNQ